MYNRGAYATILDTGCVGASPSCDGPAVNPYIVALTATGTYALRLTVYGDCKSLGGGTAWNLNIICFGSCG
jgi:hypothetical protein